MAEALAHRSDGEMLSAVIDRQPRRAVVMAASVTDAASGISLALDGSLVNAADLRRELAKRGYPFKGETDAEVLLRAYQHWDKEVVKQLRGAFAFAIWDAPKERLMLARDRFGQKPLHLHEAGGALSFASEIKALVRAPGVQVEIDTQAVGEYLAHRYVRGPRTLIAGVRKLAPGSYAFWQFGTLRETRYWSPPDGEAPIVRGPANPLDGFIERLDEAVHLNMNAGRPVGVLLSGGYDSAAIVALARTHHDQVTTFSAGFADDKRSELVAAGRVAKHFGTQHHEIVLQRNDVLAHLPRLVASRDAPVSRPADVALYLLAREAARKVPVALSGDGSDEILGGYRRHTFLRGFAPASMTAARRVNGLFVIPVSDPKAPAELPNAGLRSILYYEQTGWLADNLLERSDRMAAAASLELRMPFLDHRVAEYVSALPDAARVRGLSTKWILRQADRRLITDTALKPRKAGFRIPLGDLMRGEGVLDPLRGTGSLTRLYYDARVLDRVLDEQLSGKRNHEETLWTLLNLEIWSRNLSAEARRR